MVSSQMDYAAYCRVVCHCSPSTALCLLLPGLGLSHYVTPLPVGSLLGFINKNSNGSWKAETGRGDLLLSLLACCSCQHPLGNSLTPWQRHLLPGFRVLFSLWVHLIVPRTELGISSDVSILSGLEPSDQAEWNISLRVLGSSSTDFLFLMNNFNLFHLFS